jgi:isoleucyl-tRNA synthetase
MPVWESEDGERIVISSIAELEELSGKKVKDLHRPYIDEITFEKDGKKFTRIPEVLDSWFEAASMPYAQFHYPFENKEKFEKNFPGDYIVEYMPQVRAWFNVMHRLSTAIFGTNSFKNVICTGVLAGSDGRKMSKTYKNYSDPKETLEKYGGDALRLWLLGSPLMLGENANFDEQEIQNKQRSVVNILWNSLNYFVLYANKYNWSSEVGKQEVTSSKHPLDIWIMARLEITTKEIATNLEKYIIPPAVSALENLVDDLSHWYIRRSRDRISSGDIMALSTLYTVLTKLSLISAPLIPFVSESVYQVLKKPFDPDSVHLCFYPDYDEKIISDGEAVLEKMLYDRSVVSWGLGLRERAKITLRQPLSEFITLKEVNYPEIVKEELNLKTITIMNKNKLLLLGENYLVDTENFVAIKTEINRELEIEGQKRFVIRQLQGQRKKIGTSLSTKILATIEDTPLNKEVLSLYEAEIKEIVGAMEIKLGTSYAVEKI